MVARIRILDPSVVPWTIRCPRRAGKRTGVRPCDPCRTSPRATVWPAYRPASPAARCHHRCCERCLPGQPSVIQNVSWVISTPLALFSWYLIPKKSNQSLFGCATESGDYVFYAISIICSSEKFSPHLLTMTCFSLLAVYNLAAMSVITFRFNCTSASLSPGNRGYSMRKSITTSKRHLL